MKQMGLGQEGSDNENYYGSEISSCNEDGEAEEQKQEFLEEERQFPLQASQLECSEDTPLKTSDNEKGEEDSSVEMGY